MNCPRCGADTRVEDSHPVKGVNTIRRKRVCLSCGHKFVSNERPRPIYDPDKKRKSDRESARRKWQSLSVEERAQINKRKRLRADARKEAKVSNRPLKQVYFEMGVQ